MNAVAARRLVVQGLRRGAAAAAAGGGGGGGGPLGALGRVPFNPNPPATLLLARHFAVINGALA
jgi:hypothetical protein